MTAREKIVHALSNLRGRSLLGVGDIAHAAGVAQSTVRRHLPSLIEDGYLQHTSYVRYYGLGRESYFNRPGLMSPDANLKRQRELAADLIALADSTRGYDPHDIAVKAVELAELVQALDEWMTKGGFLPAAWAQCLPRRV